MCFFFSRTFPSARAPVKISLGWRRRRNRAVFIARCTVGAGRSASTRARVRSHGPGDGGVVDGFYKTARGAAAAESSSCFGPKTNECIILWRHTHRIKYNSYNIITTTTNARRRCRSRFRMRFGLWRSNGKKKISVENIIIFLHPTICLYYIPIIIVGISRYEYILIHYRLSLFFYFTYRFLRCVQETTVDTNKVDGYMGVVIIWKKKTDRKTSNIFLL